MNIYDTKTIRCVKCDKPVGEIDFDARVSHPICGQCYDPKPDVKDYLSYRTMNSASRLERPIALNSK